MPRHFHDDDYDDRHYEEERTSARPYILMILGIALLVGLGGFAAVGLFYFRFQAVQQERDAAQAAAVTAISKTVLAISWPFHAYRWPAPSALRLWPKPEPPAAPNSSVSIATLAAKAFSPSSITPRWRAPFSTAFVPNQSEGCCGAAG